MSRLAVLIFVPMLLQNSHYYLLQLPYNFLRQDLLLLHCFVQALYSSYNYMEDCRRLPMLLHYHHLIQNN